MVSQSDDDSSSYSSSNRFEIRFRDKSTHSSHLTNMQEVFKLSMPLSADQETKLTSHDKTKEDAICAGHERVSYTNVDEKEKNEEDGVDDLCVLENALEAATTTSFQGLSKFHKKLMFGNLKKLGVKRRRELSDEWKALVVEELQLNIKKQTFAGELANSMIC
ncbi:GLABROUS1 enhancer-binding protein-like 3 [Cardamine amara subsp. amara]|uniref:GLABROUS1 enhancer-binding protein-like 3 n=1 Tax=Cardamine amara subsp. amara TaxID=228776 RepID=A0ABD1C842_CARAN